MMDSIFGRVKNRMETDFALGSIKIKGIWRYFNLILNSLPAQLYDLFISS